MTQPAKKHRPSWTNFDSSKKLAPVVKLPSNAGMLTWQLSMQKKTLRYFVAASLQSGLVPSDAVPRATSCLEALRNEAVTRELDSEEQLMALSFATAALRCPSLTSGFVIAVRAVEAVRLAMEWRKKTKKLEKSMAEKGKVQ